MFAKCVLLKTKSHFKYQTVQIELCDDLSHHAKISVFELHRQEVAFPGKSKTVLALKQKTSVYCKNSKNISTM